MTGSCRAAALWRAIRLLACAACAWPAAGAAAQTGAAAPAHAAVSLVAEADTLTPGTTAWAGVLFEMEPGWHIYWVNPGDAGDPPRLRWEMPAGFKAGDIRWPVPTRLVLGPVIDYGYEGRVLLVVPIEVPSGYASGTPATLAADVRYVICKDVCIPARSHVTLTVPSSPGAGRKDLFAAARARWPQPLPARWSATAAVNGNQFALTVNTGQAQSTATFFPLDPDQIDNAAPIDVSATSTGLKMVLERSDPDGPPPAALKGVLVLGDGRAYEISAATK